MVEEVDMHKRTSAPSVLFGIDLNWRRPQLLIFTAVVSMAGLVACSAGQDGLQELDRKSVDIGTGRLMSPSTAVRSYFGIPYAAPPVGDLRWKPPQPAAQWSEVKLADTPGPACMQPARAPRSLFPDPFERKSEDCLYLNVWTTADQGDDHPVMVWFHGGGWNTGSGMSYTADGGPLVKKGVVLVTVNYRLGVFGSLAHPELTAESPQGASGNYGFLDQQAALSWVQDNIRAFGGDPRRVTIFGESAGSWSVNVLVASPLSAGLFHRAIGQSGGRFEPAPHLTEERYKLKSGEQRGLDYTAALGAESLDDLRASSADQLLSIPFRGQEIIDGWVLPDDVRTIFAEGRQNHVPVIVGSNGSEATAFLHPTWPTTLQEYRQHVNAEYGQYAEAFSAAYPVNSVEDIPAVMYGARRDWRFAWPMRAWARATTAAGETKAYLYDFSYIPPHPWSEDLGAYHTAEIPYVFNHLTTSRVSASWYLKERDYQLAQIMSSYWVNFATTGDPNGEGLPKWEPYNLAAEPYLDFGEVVQLSHGLRPIELDFVEEYLTSKYGADY